MNIARTWPSVVCVVTLAFAATACSGCRKPEKTAATEHIILDVSSDGEPRFRFPKTVMPSGSDWKHDWGGHDWTTGKPTAYKVTVTFRGTENRLDIQVSNVQRDGAGHTTSYDITYTGTVGGESVSGAAGYP
jgi:hypothetical protein